MMQIKGYWYDGKQSGQQTALIHIDNNGYLDVLAAPADGSDVAAAKRSLTLFSGQLKHVSVSSRLGNTARYLYFAEGQKFETRDNDQVDQLVRQYFPQQGNKSLLYRLETRWHYVLIATLLMIGIAGWTGIYGLPAVANGISKALPQSVSAKAGEQTLSLLDNEMMQPTRLDDQVQQRVRQHFDKIMQDHPQQVITLHFRSSNIGANALALPDGSIIFTDDMIKLARDDDELLAVMAHEIGHVVHRHGMRSVIQGSLLGFILMLMTGDAGAATELFLGLPIMLTQLGYSREFEHEADDYAFDYMMANNIDTGHFARLMIRLENQHCDALPVGNDSGVNPETCQVADDSWQRYLSTHPGTKERIERFIRHSDAWE